jgi:hypothetical protein
LLSPRRLRSQLLVSRNPATRQNDEDGVRASSSKPNADGLHPLDFRRYKTFALNPQRSATGHAAQSGFLALQI